METKIIGTEDCWYQYYFIEIARSLSISTSHITLPAHQRFIIAYVI